MATSNYRTIQTNFTEGVQFVKNYIPNATFNNGSVNNWSKFTTTLTSGLPTGALTLGTAGSITTFAPTTTTPISGSASMQIGSSAAWAAGQGVITDEFTIEREDLGKPLTFSLSFEAITNPLNANWSGILGSQTFAIYIYDATVGAWIQPSGFLGMNQNSGVGQVMGNFQSSVTSGQKYRLAIIALQASSGAITLNFDNFSVGKETSTVGSPVTDFIQFTPTINWSTGFNTLGYYRRVGDSIDVITKINFTAAPTPSSVDLIINLPAGLSIDTTKMLSPVAGGAPTCGDAVFYNEGTPGFHTFKCQYFSPTSLKLYFQTNVLTAVESPPITNQVPVFIVGDDYLIARYTVPIVGFSGSVQMSNATDTRVVDFVGTVTAQSLTANITNLSLTTVKDSHASWSTNQYVIPVSGDYVICGTASTSSNLAFSLEAYVDNIITSCLGANQTTTAARLNLSTLIPNLRAGQVITIKSNVTINLNAPSIDRISIFRLSGPSVIAASENIICRYSNLSGTLSTSTDSLVTFTTKNIDTHNIYSSGVATIPISGTYLVSAQIVSSSTTAVRSNTVCIYKGVSLYAFKAYGVNTSSSGTNLDNMVTSLVPCLAGETISIKVNDNGATPTVLASSTRCFLSIVKVDK